MPSARTGTTMTPKTILGKTDRFDGDKLADLLLQHPATARRLAWRLCQAFLGENVADESAIADLAERLRADNLHIGRAVETILRSELFFSTQEPARPGLGAGRVRHRHGAEPRAASTRRRARSCSPSGPDGWARTCSFRPTSADGPAAGAGCRAGRSWHGPTSPRRWSMDDFTQVRTGDTAGPPAAWPHGTVETTIRSRSSTNCSSAGNSTGRDANRSSRMRLRPAERHPNASTERSPSSSRGPKPS